METHLPRNEILRLVRSLLGIQTTSGLAVQVYEQHTTAVQMAAAKVAQDCRWVNAQKRVTVTLGAQQNVIDYPEAVGPGSVIDIAIYFTDRYIPLTPRVIPVETDTDQEVAVGGATLVGVTGLPRHYEQKNQILLWPRSNQAYPLRIEYMQPMNLPLDSSVSVVDATLIVYRAAAMISAQMQDVSGAAYYELQYADRLGDLRAWQNSVGEIPLSTQADLGEDEISLDSRRPNWSTIPTPPVL